MATVVQAATVFHEHCCHSWLEKLVAEAAALGSQLAVFPEAFVGGRPRGTCFVEWLSEDGKEKFRKDHASAIDIPEDRRWERMAGKYGMYIVGGLIERDGQR
ncbi:hypothetical protein MLD38_004089 [Melastoma candidum]|uniref:Uncharacterized protein n=1 Tax=Melastoma candidum TaxID=119954 RepID=A0ACB9S4Q9_9MYRT|nr:hypothetical protein MLD38_004089 [Melastoma candidum]